MKICHVTSAHNSSDVRIFEKECTSLAKLPENVVYLISPGSSYIKNNVKIIGIGEKPNSRLKRISKFSKIAYEKAMEIDADVYHLHDPELLPYAKKIKARGKKVIFDSHENYYEQILKKKYIPKLLRRFVALIYRVMENHACNYLDAAIFPCKIRGKHIFEGRVKNCEFIDNVPLLSESKTSSLINEKKENAVCCVGSLTEDRGIRFLIDACYIADVKLILGGNFYPKTFEKEMQEKKEYKIVDYRGFCVRDEVISIYNQSKIGISTILSIGQYPMVHNLPTKVYECMMMGMPCIISDFEYSKKMIEKYKFGIAVNPTNPEEIAGAIKYLIDNPNTANQMGQNGKKAIEENFNWSIEEKKLYRLYFRLNELENDMCS